jgi:hypothetical protein
MIKHKAIAVSEVAIFITALFHRFFVLGTLYSKRKIKAALKAFLFEAMHYAVPKNKQKQIV